MDSFNKEMGYLSFDCYCVEVAKIPYYTQTNEEEYEDIVKEYILYCKSKEIPYDEDYDGFVEI